MSPSNSIEPWVILTGCSRGLGLAMAHQLIADGWQVAGFSSKHNADLQALKTLHGERFFWQKLDIGDTQAIEQAVDQASKHFEKAPLWGLVNNAAISIDGVLATLPVVDIERVLQVNLTGAMILARSVLRRMLRQRKGGRVINISSITGSRGYTGLSSYAASKAGLDGFTRSLAREVGRLAITVNSVAPGYMRTALSEGLDEGQLQQIVRRTPLGRLCQVEDVVNLVQFLLGSKAQFITGQVLTIDGGLTC